MSDTKAGVEPPYVKIYEELPLDRPTKVNSEKIREMIAQADAIGMKRKKILRGEAGFFMNRSYFPPGFRVPEHSHSHSEFLMVLSGGCTFDDGIVLGENDTIVINAHYRYGFTMGDEGMDFITVRVADAAVTMGGETTTT